MERIIRKCLLLSVVIFSGSWGVVIPSQAQDYNLQVRLKDGTVKSLPVKQIASIDYEQDTPPTYEGLTGNWMLIASPVGSPGEGGVYTSRTDTIRFTATLADDGSCLQCRAESQFSILNSQFSILNSQLDWQVVVEQNEQDGTRRLGWVLSKDKPVATLSDGRELYFLSENITTQRLEGMTLYSSWGGADATTYIFPQNQEIYAVAGSDILEIWASPRFVKE